MSPHTRPAPRGFRWADAPIGRAIVTVLSVVSLGLSLFVGYQYVDLINCLSDRDRADAVRTRAIADATDGERKADLALLMGPQNGGTRTAADLRELSVRARQHTDAVRAANPAPTPQEAQCR